MNKGLFVHIVAFAGKYHGCTYFWGLPSSMQLKPQNERILFGLKLRQLRLQRGLSFQQLARAAGMSVSYLNEIEKGKKSPKAAKLRELAHALEVPVETFVELKFDESLRPVAELLRSNFLNELPLDRFGIELSKIVEIIASAPARVGAFISTLLELSRNYAVLDENFYLGALRSWLEMHSNYLEESEVAAAGFRQRLGWATGDVPSADELQSLLTREFGYHVSTIDPEVLPAFRELNTVYLPEERHLMLAPALTGGSLRYYLAVELGYQLLAGTEQRSLVDPLLRVRTFDVVLNRARAHHFAAALLLPPEQFNRELQLFFGDREPALNAFQRLLLQYQVRPDLLLDRIATLLPRFRSIPNLFLIQLEESEGEQLQIVRELHLGQQHRPHASGLFEHYCRRWIGARVLLEYSGRPRIGVQISKYYGSEEEYFVLAIADAAPTGARQATFIGLPFTAELERAIPSLLRADLVRRTVNNTCERCPITDCQERVAPPTVVRARQQRKAVEKTIAALQHLHQFNQANPA